MEIAALDVDVMNRALKKFSRPEDTIMVCVGAHGMRLTGAVTRITEKEIPDPPFVEKTKEREILEENIPKAELIHLSDFGPGKVMCCEIDAKFFKGIFQKKRSIDDSIMLQFSEDNKLVFEQRTNGLSRKIETKCQNFE